MRVGDGVKARSKSVRSKKKKKLNLREILMFLPCFRPGRQIVTFLLVANISMWFINTLIKGHASFRPSHLEVKTVIDVKHVLVSENDFFLLQFFGQWAWVIITHVSMPLAIFYRFHSTICLFDIWKSAYKFKVDH